MWPSFRQFFPFPVGNLPKMVQYHLTIFHLAKKMNPILGANGDKIHAFFAIIISAETHTAPVMDVWIVFHIGLVC
jgi:hypothetical protein